MKKVKIATLIFLMVIVMGGCSVKTNSSDTGKEDQYTPFVLIYNGREYDIYVDRDTKVMYQASDGSYNSGTWLVLLDSDGTPKLYDSNTYTEEYNPFVLIYNGREYDTYVDGDTKVMYQASDGSYNTGTWLALVNPDGTPKLYDGEIR